MTVPWVPSSDASCEYSSSTLVIANGKAWPCSDFGVVAGGGAFSGGGSGPLDSVAPSGGWKSNTFAGRSGLRSIPVRLELVPQDQFASMVDTHPAVDSPNLSDHAWREHVLDHPIMRPHLDAWLGAPLELRAARPGVPE
jgi:hypothetical protein